MAPEDKSAQTDRIPVARRPPRAPTHLFSDVNSHAPELQDSDSSMKPLPDVSVGKAPRELQNQHGYARFRREKAKLLFTNITDYEKTASGSVCWLLLYEVVAVPVLVFAPDENFEP